MKTKLITTFFILALVAFFARAAHAQVQVGNLNAPTAVAAPLNGFSVDYLFFGSSVLASAQLNFYLSASPDGSTGVWTLASEQVLLRRGTGGLHYPPNGTQSRFFSRTSMSAGAIAVLESICQPQTWYILARVEFGNITSDSSSLGTNRVDLRFNSSAVQPSSIPAGSSTNLSFQVASPCPVNRDSYVGIYLLDQNNIELFFVGEALVGAGAGPWTLSPTPLNFPVTFPPGSYKIEFRADLDGFINESNESNNRVFHPLTITAPAATSERKQDPVTWPLTLEALQK